MLLPFEVDKLYVGDRRSGKTTALAQWIKDNYSVSDSICVCVQNVGIKEHFKEKLEELGVQNISKIVFTSPNTDITYSLRGRLFNKFIFDDVDSYPEYFLSLHSHFLYQIEKAKVVVSCMPIQAKEIVYLNPL